MLHYLKSAVGWLMDFTLDLIFIHGRRLVCRHEWRKDEIATRAGSGHPLVKKGMFVKAMCRKCYKPSWLMR